MQRGLDEEMLAKIDDFENSDLSDRHKAALRFAHAFLTDPHGFDAAAQAELLRHFTPVQIAEIALDLIKLRPSSKLVIAMGLEPETDDIIVM